MKKSEIIVDMSLLQICEGSVYLIIQTLPSSTQDGCTTPLICFGKFQIKSKFKIEKNLQSTVPLIMINFLQGNMKKRVFTSLCIIFGS